MEATWTPTGPLIIPDHCYLGLDDNESIYGEFYHRATELMVIIKWLITVLKALSRHDILVN